MSPFVYRREVDGLRALAVVPVILFHAGIPGFGGGYVGVDVFFVISGYLITSIIIAEQDAGSFTLLGFYERRARRILPALMLVVLCTLPMAWAWLLPDALESFGGSLSGIALFASNIFFWRESGYFEQAAELKPMLHTWSLAVEEQYYLLFPLLLGALRKHARPLTTSVLLFVTAVSLAIAHWGSGASPSAAFFLLPSRAWEILLGSFVALHVARHGLPVRHAGVANLGGMLGLAMLAIATVYFDKSTPVPGLPALLPTLGTALVILFAAPGNWSGRLLGHRWLVGIGLISFSAYLWHQPLLAFARHRSLHEPAMAVMASLAASSLVLAYASWRFVEKPFRNRRQVGKRAILGLSIAGPLALLAAGGAMVANNGFEGRFPQLSLNRDAYRFASAENGWCFYSVDSLGKLQVGAAGQTCQVGNRQVQPRVLLFGDSFAGQYEPFWDDVGREMGLGIRAITTNWCFPSQGEDFTGPRGSRAFAQCLSNRELLLRTAANYDVVILAGHWGQVLNQRKMEGTLQLVEALSSRVGVVLLMPSPKLFDVDVNRLYRKALSFGEPFGLEGVGTSSDRHALAAHAALNQLSQRLPNVIFIDRETLFSVNGQAEGLMQDGIPFSWDGSHISVRGARAAAARYLESPQSGNLRQLVRTP